MGQILDFFGGGSSEPSIIVPPENAPTAFQTIIPRKSYKDIAQSTARTNREFNRVLDKQYDAVGTGADMGARKAATDLIAASGYAASLPGATEADKQRLRDDSALVAKDYKNLYLGMVDLAKKKPRSFKEIDENPSYAQNPSSMYLPKKLDKETKENQS